MTIMGFSEALQRRVRLGSWEDQKISTYRKVLESLEQQRWDDAAALAAYFVDEAAVCWHLYRQWLSDLEGFLRDGCGSCQRSRRGECGARHSRGKGDLATDA
jgi:hypothetical protein